MSRLLLLLFAVPCLSAGAATVETASCDASASLHGQARLLDGSSANNLNAWSHITADGEDIEGLRQGVEAYAARLQPVPEPHCPLPVYKLLLVKKYHDWHQQHLSGLEILFPRGPVRLKNIQELRLRLRIDSDGTYIPSAETYQSTYGDWLTDEQMTALDDQQVNLELTLFDPNHADQSIPSLNASYRLSLDPGKDLDQWLEVRLPVEEMRFFLQENRESTAVDSGDYLEHPMVGLRINPETGSGKVARHFLGEKYGPAVPRLYKEVQVSLQGVSYSSAAKGSDARDSKP